MLPSMTFQTIGHGPNVFYVCLWESCSNVCAMVCGVKSQPPRSFFRGHHFDFGDRVPYWTWSLLTRLGWLPREPRDPPPSTSWALELCPASHMNGGIQLRCSCCRGKRFTDWAVFSSDRPNFFVQHQYNHLFLSSISQHPLFCVVALAWLGLLQLLWVPLWRISLISATWPS